MQEEPHVPAERRRDIGREAVRGVHLEDGVPRRPPRLDALVDVAGTAEEVVVGVVLAVGLAHRLDVQPAGREQRERVGRLELGRVADVQPVQVVRLQLGLDLALAVRPPEHARRIVRVLPVAPGQSRVEAHEVGRLECPFQLDAHVTGIDSEQVHQQVDVLGRTAGGLDSGPVLPLGEVDVGVEGEPPVQRAEPRPGLERRELLVLGVLDLHAGAVVDHAVEDRHLGDVPGVAVDRPLGAHVPHGAALELIAGDAAAVQLQKAAARAPGEEVGEVVGDSRQTDHAVEGPGLRGLLRLQVGADPADVVLVVVVDLVAESPVALGFAPEVGAAASEAVVVVAAAQQVSDLPVVLDGGGPPVHAQLRDQSVGKVLLELGDGAPRVLVVHRVAQDARRGAVFVAPVALDGGVPVREALAVGVVPAQRPVGAGAAPVAAGVVGHRVQRQPVPEVRVPVQVDLGLVEVVLALVDEVPAVTAEDSGAGARAGELSPGVRRAHAAYVGVPVAAGLGREAVQSGGIVVVQAGGEIPAQRGQVEPVPVLAVALGCAYRVQLQPVVVADPILGGHVVRPGVGPRPVDQAVPGLPHARGGQRELADGAGGRGHRRLQEVPAAELLLEVVARRLLARVRDHVERAADGGRGQVHRAQPALELDARGGVAQSVPVGPVDPAVLHVVDGHAVDHHGRVPLAEAPDVDPRVAGASALNRGVHRRRDAQHQRQVPRTQLRLDLGLGDVRERHGRPALLRALGQHFDPAQRHRRRGHGEVHHRRSAGIENDPLRRGGEADHLDHHLVGASGHADDVVAPALIGDAAVLRPGLRLGQHDLGVPDAGSVGRDGPGHRSRLLGVRTGRHGKKRQQSGHANHLLLHPSRPPLGVFGEAAPLEGNRVCCPWMLPAKTSAGKDPVADSGCGSVTDWSLASDRASPGGSGGGDQRPGARPTTCAEGTGQNAVATLQLVFWRPAAGARRRLANDN